MAGPEDDGPDEGCPARDGDDGADYDYDFLSLLTKMQLGVELRDRKTRLGRMHRRCFTGKDAVDWLIATQICSDAAEAVHLLNRMLRRGHIHHVGLSKLVENRPMLFYRFAQDEYAMLVERYERQRLKTGSWSGPARAVTSVSSGGTDRAANGDANSAAGGGGGGGAAAVTRGLVSSLSGGIAGIRANIGGGGDSAAANGGEEGSRGQLRRRQSMRFGAVPVPDQWYDRVPVVPQDKIEHAARRMVYDMSVGDTTRSLRTFKKAFTGRAAVKFLVSQGFATSASTAVMFGNALLRAGVFWHVSMELPFTDSGAIYRLAEDHYQLLLEKYLMSKPRLVSSVRGPGTTSGAKGSAALAAANAAAAAASGLGGPSALESATASRYWTSYRASKLYDLNLVVQEAFLDMSDDWDSHLDGLFSTYCECYLTRDKEGTSHRTGVAPKSLHLVWHAPIFFSDVDYLDTVRIDLKARSQMGADLSLGSLEFEAHEVMGSKARPIVLEFECGSRQFVEGAAAIITVQFDPQVAANADGGAGGDAHHHLLRNETIRELETAAAAFDEQEGEAAGKWRGSKLSIPLGASMHGGPSRDGSGRKGGAIGGGAGGGNRGSIVRPSVTQSATNLGSVYVSVSGHSGAIMLQDLDSLAADGRMASFGTYEQPSAMAPFSPWQANGYVGPVVPAYVPSTVLSAAGQGPLPANAPALRRGSGSRRPSMSMLSLDNIEEEGESHTYEGMEGMATHPARSGSGPNSSNLGGQMPAGEAAAVAAAEMLSGAKGKVAFQEASARHGVLADSSNSSSGKREVSNSGSSGLSVT